MSSRTRASSPGGTLIQSGTFAARPAAGIANRYYWATDVQILFRDTGVAWEIVSAGIQSCIYIQSEKLKESGDMALLPITGATQNWVWLTPIVIPFTVTLDALVHHTEDPAAGNTYKGIYADNGLTPAGAALIVQAGPQAVGVTYRRVVDAIPDTRLTPGLYWMAGIISDPTDVHAMRNMVGGIAPNLLRMYYYDRGAFGALIDPCPAVAEADGGFILSARVKSIP